MTKQHVAPLSRRLLAATVVVPPSAAEHLNMDAMAVLASENEAGATGRCVLPLARIAERANIGRAKTRPAIRLAESLGVIAIEEPNQQRVIINRSVT